jgi:hypothetical protein
MDTNLALIPVLAVNGIILSWIDKLEKRCACSTDWRRDYIKYYAILSIILAVVNVFVPLFLAQQNTPVLAIITIAIVINIGSILSYIPNLKKKQCDCAIENDWRDNFIFVWFILNLILPVIAGGYAAFILTRK